MNFTLALTRTNIAQKWLVPFSILLVLLSTQLTDAQLKASTRNPALDLDVAFTVSNSGSAPNSVVGMVRNKSSNSYPCVQLLFDLYGRDPLTPSSSGLGYVGTLPAHVKNINAGGTTNFQRTMPFAARPRLKTVYECDPRWDPAEQPHIVSFKGTPGTIRAGQTARLQWTSLDATDVFITEHSPNDSNSGGTTGSARRVNTSGITMVTPQRTTRYDLEVKKGGYSTVDKVLIAVQQDPNEGKSGIVKIQLCRRISNIDGPGRVGCIGPDADDRYLGYPRPFPRNSEIWILLRIKKLPPGTHRLLARYYGPGNSKISKEMTFTNQGESWAFWFPAQGKAVGNWHVSATLMDDRVDLHHGNSMYVIQ